MGHEINRRIARYRKMRGFRQEDVACAIGMKTSTYSQCERIGNISAEKVIEIARVLDVEVDTLLFGEDENSEKPISKPIIAKAPEYALNKTEKDLITMFRYVSKQKREKIMEFTYKEFKTPQRRANKNL